MQMELVFVYGTLMKGLPAHYMLEEEGTVSLGKGEIGARLFDLGNFPAVVETEEDGRIVKGELYRVSKSLLRTLDGYESVANGFYRREQVEVAADSFPAGHNVFIAWVYFFNQDLWPNARLIPDGDYRKFFEETQDGLVL